jgi:hypothetical protein
MPSEILWIFWPAWTFLLYFTVGLLIFLLGYLNFSTVLCWGYGFWLICPRSKTLGNTYIFIRKYQESPVNFRKYYKLPGNSRSKTWNTRKYFVKNMKYFDIFTRLLFDLSFSIDWDLNYFSLFTGIYEFSNFMKRNFVKIYALKMSEITIFDVIDEKVAVLPSFLKVCWNSVLTFGHN